MRSGPVFRPLIAALPATVPFVGPEAQERRSGVRFRARIGANENLFGCSPRAIEAMTASLTEIWQYGDPEGLMLREAIAAHHGVDADEVVVGAGIDGLLGLAARLFVEPGVHVVTSDGAYPTFNFHIAQAGGTLHKVRYAQDREDLDGLAARARETGARLVYVSNPDNPMGSWWPAEVILGLVDALPEGCLLLLDEAYVECAPAGVAPPFDTSDPRVLRLRTFSKAYGMAGARVGYAIGERSLIAAFEKVRDHYGMNRTAEIGAAAALADADHLGRVVRGIEEARRAIGEIAVANGLRPLPSATNFVTLDTGRDTAFAKALLTALLARGIFVRMPVAEPLSRCIRVTCAPRVDLEAFAAVLPEALASVSSR